MAPGAWHHHELLRPSSVVYLQGLLPAQSDVSLFVGGTTYGTLIPLEPSRLLLHRFFDADGASAAYSLCDELIGQFLTERAQDWVIPAGPLARMTFYYWHHLHQPIGAADIVHAGGLGPTHAGRLFRSYHHQSPKAALETSRLAIARQLLREGMAIGEIPRRCGFASLNHFERAFRRIEGLAPRVWRERHALRGWGPRGPR
jgi:AraC-like DNA-binding protein